MGEVPGAKSLEMCARMVHKTNFNTAIGNNALLQEEETIVVSSSSTRR